MAFSVYGLESLRSGMSTLSPNPEWATPSGTRNQRRRCCRSEHEEEAAMSIAKKAGLIVGVISVAVTRWPAPPRAAKAVKVGASGTLLLFPVLRGRSGARRAARVCRAAVMYAPPPPVYYDPPVYAPRSPSLNFNIPLR